MPVTADDLLFTGCANPAENDTDTQGGAEDKQVRVTFEGGEMSGSGTLYMEADESISGTWRVTGRRAGAVVTEDFVFDAEAGPQAGSQIFDYILKVVKTAGTLLSTATLGLYETAGDANLTYLYGSGVDVAGVEVTEVRRLFPYSIIPGGGSTIRWEKFFVRNLHHTDAVSDGEGRETADPDSLFEFAVETSLNGTTSAANRITDPTGSPPVMSAFSSLNKALAVNLTAGNAIAIWAKYTLASTEGAGAYLYNQQLFGKAFA